MLDIRIQTIDSSFIHNKILNEIKDNEKKLIIRNILIKKYGFNLKKVATSNTLPELQKERIEKKIYYDLNDFIKYYDEEFVVNCYLGLLHREPDSSGLAGYLNKLRSGKLHKIEILGRIALSKEARKNKVKVSGLKSRFLIRMFYKIPIIGYMLKLLIIIVKLPRIIDYQEHINNKIMEKVNAASFFSHHEAYLNEIAISKLINDSNLNNDTLMNGIGTLIQELTEKEGSLKGEEGMLKNE